MKENINPLHKAGQVFKALLIGLEISSQGNCYTRIGDLLTIKLRNITKDEDHWGEYPFNFSSIKQIAEEMTDDEYFIMCANITLNELKFKKY